MDDTFLMFTTYLYHTVTKFGTVILENPLFSLHKRNCVILGQTGLNITKNILAERRLPWQAHLKERGYRHCKALRSCKFEKFLCLCTAISLR